MLRYAAFQTMIALATSDAEHDADKTGKKPYSIMVKDEHFQAVVERRRRFISYRKSMQTKDEQARANSDEACATCSKKGQ
jgi:excinuclease UvrABC ATPase subunit